MLDVKKFSPMIASKITNKNVKVVKIVTYNVKNVKTSSKHQIFKLINVKI